MFSIFIVPHLLFNNFRQCAVMWDIGAVSVLIVFLFVSACFEEYGRYDSKRPLWTPCAKREIPWYKIYSCICCFTLCDHSVWDRWQDLLYSCNHGNETLSHHSFCWCNWSFSHNDSTFRCVYTRIIYGFSIVYITSWISWIRLLVYIHMLWCVHLYLVQVSHLLILCCIEQHSGWTKSAAEI